MYPQTIASPTPLASWSDHEQRSVVGLRKCLDALFCLIDGQVNALLMGDDLDLITIKLARINGAIQAVLSEADDRLIDLLDLFHSHLEEQITANRVVWPRNVEPGLDVEFERSIERNFESDYKGRKIQ